MCKLVMLPLSSHNNVQLLQISSKNPRHCTQQRESQGAGTFVEVLVKFVEVFGLLHRVMLNQPKGIRNEFHRELFEV